jgi:hypothetical protein
VFGFYVFAISAFPKIFVSKKQAFDFSRSESPRDRRLSPVQGADPPEVQFSPVQSADADGGDQEEQQS